MVGRNNRSGAEQPTHSCCWCYALPCHAYYPYVIITKYYLKIEHFPTLRIFFFSLCHSAVMMRCPEIQRGKASSSSILQEPQHGLKLSCLTAKPALTGNSHCLQFHHNVPYPQTPTKSKTRNLKS